MNVVLPNFHKPEASEHRMTDGVQKRHLGWLTLLLFRPVDRVSKGEDVRIDLVSKLEISIDLDLPLFIQDPGIQRR